MRDSLFIFLGGLLVFSVGMCGYVLGTHTAAEQSTISSTSNDITESSVVAEVLDSGSFSVGYSKGVISEVPVDYTVYADEETGYCFARLRTIGYTTLLIPLVNADGSEKENLNSNTNVISLVGVSDDEAVIVIEDEDTGVQYVCNVNMSSYFKRY